MTSECSRESVEQEAENTEGGVLERGDVFGSLLRGLFWPFSFVVQAFRWLRGVRGLQEAPERLSPGPAASSPARPSLTARKRLHWVTRVLLFILPRWAQGFMGYPVSSSIGRSLSPEISVSPTKLHGKGSKRKQDDLDEDEEDEHPTWVEVLSQEVLDEGSEEDPDYEPSSVETDSEEYTSHNSTESDLHISRGEVVIEDVNTNPRSVPAEAACPEV